MRCHRARTLYEEYSSGALALATVARIEEHLAGCPPCREYFEQNDQIARALRQASTAAQPDSAYFEGLNARVLAALEQPVDREHRALERTALQVPPPWRRPLWWGGFAAAAALLALALLPEQPSQRLVAGSITPPNKNSMQPLLKSNVPYNVASAPGFGERRELDLTGLGWQFGPEIPIFSMDKGIGGIGRNDRAVESIIAKGKTAEKSLSTMDQNFSPSQSRMDMDAAIQDVSYSRPSSVQNRLPPEIYEKLQQIKAQLASVGEEALINELRVLDRMLQRRGAERSGLLSVSQVRMAKLYLRAADKLSDGHPESAGSDLKQILLIDETAPLAMRARLQLADLYFSVWADFQRAEENYRPCLGTAAESALAPSERTYVQHQMEKLEKYRNAKWEPLNLLFQMRTGNWTEAATALQQLAEIPGSESLLPEAAGTMVARLNSSSKAGVQVTQQIYNLLAKQAEVAQNGDVRARLYLALGDMAQDQYQDARQAVEHYRRALLADAGSEAAKTAGIKLADLNDRLLVDPVR